MSSGRDASCIEALACIGTSPDLVRVIDTETTGLDPEHDELLQVSVIDGNGTVLLDSLVHPCRLKEWPDAQAVNGISSEMVRDAPTVSDLLPRIGEVLSGAGMIVGYNVAFDIGFLESAGIEIPACPVCDVMECYAPVAGVRLPDGGWKRQRLTSCASRYGHVYKPHDPLGDAMATLYCCRCVALEIIEGGIHAVHP